MKETFASQVRAAAKVVQKRDGNVSLRALEEACGTLVQTMAARKLVGSTVLDFCKIGEMRRVSRAVYEYLGKEGPVQKQQIMWRYLRSGRTFGGVTVADLMEVAGAAQNYVLEWLKILARQGIVKEAGDKWQLLADPVEMPVLDAKAERLRAIRAKKRAKVLDALARAKTAIEEAERFISRGDAESAEGAEE